MKLILRAGTTGKLLRIFVQDTTKSTRCWDVVRRIIPREDNNMLTAIEGLYADGKVELQETPRGIVRSRVIVTFLPDLPDQGPGGSGVELYGVWKDKVPANVDVDKLLRDVRREWTEDIEALNG